MMETRSIARRTERASGNRATLWTLRRKRLTSMLGSYDTRNMGFLIFGRKKALARLVGNEN
jgi:hypothetical protein